MVFPFYFLANTLNPKEWKEMNVQLFIKKNASTILTCVGAAGVVATAVLAVNETPKAMSLLDDAMEEKGESLTKWEKVKIAGPAYAPAIITGAATIACIFGSNVLSKQHQASLASAYALIDKSYREYKNKTDELYGEESGKQIRGEIAKDKYTGDGLLSDNTKELFFDFHSGQYFQSTKEEIMFAFYETNRKMILDNSVPLSYYYELVGIETKPEHDLVGWSWGPMEEMYWHSWIEFELEDIVIDEGEEHEGMEVTIVHMPLSPFPGFNDEY
jgi:hypothetical protein